MLVLSFTSLVLVSLSGVLVSAGPINARDAYKTCESKKYFTGEQGCTPCKSIDNVVCGTFHKKATDLVCTDKFGTPVAQWVPVNNPKICAKLSPRNPTKSPSECKSGKSFTDQAGCSKCGTEGNIVCGQDEGRVTDLICTRFGTSLSWVPIDTPGKCGVFTPPKATKGCVSGKQFQAKESCSMCANEGNVICGQDKDRQTDLKCTSIGYSLIWVPVDTPKKCSA